MTQPPLPPETSDATLRVRVVFAHVGMIGPGKADLLERIGRTGSIAAAGRELGMSYKRAWELVGTLNRMFTQPLVARTRGGTGGGGAVLTQEGHDVLALFRALERDATQAAAQHIAQLRHKMVDPADPPPS